MFGNPFKKNVSVAEFPNERCRWCLKRIGILNHFPIPVCDGCFRRAYESPAMWTRLGTEFEAEMRRWVKRIGQTVSQTDVLQTAMEEYSEIVRLNDAAGLAEKEGRTEDFRRISAEVRERFEVLARFKKEAPTVVAALDKEVA